MNLIILSEYIEYKMRYLNSDKKNVITKIKIDIQGE